MSMAGMLLCNEVSQRCTIERRALHTMEASKGEKSEALASWLSGFSNELIEQPRRVLEQAVV